MAGEAVQLFAHQDLVEAAGLLQAGRQVNGAADDSIFFAPLATDAGSYHLPTGQAQVDGDARHVQIQLEFGNLLFHLQGGLQGAFWIIFVGGGSAKNCQHAIAQVAHQPAAILHCHAGQLIQALVDQHDRFFGVELLG